MKVLFIGDYSNLHATLAAELRAQGHTTTLLSDGGGFMHTQCDVLLNRQPGIFGSMAYFSRLIEALRHARGYDVVQIINPHFLSMRPGKLRLVFNRLRRRNGSIFLTLAGSDHFYIKQCLDRTTLPYNEYLTADGPTPLMTSDADNIRAWLSEKVADYNRFIYDNVNGALSVLYEYHLAAAPYLGSRLAYAGIPVDTKRCAPIVPVEGRLKILVGRKSVSIDAKGTDRLGDIAMQLAAEHPDLCTAEIVTDLPLADYLGKIRDSHIVLDQIYAHTPATNALYTMSMQRVAASGAQPDFYRFIGEESLRPIIPLTPSDADNYDAIKRVVVTPGLYAEMAAQGPKFVGRHNAAPVVADRFMKHWLAMAASKL